jgi:hypothetical protein
MQNCGQPEWLRTSRFLHDDFIIMRSIALDFGTVHPQVQFLAHLTPYWLTPLGGMKKRACLVCNLVMLQSFANKLAILSGRTRAGKIARARFTPALSEFNGSRTGRSTNFQP